MTTQWKSPAGRPVGVWVVCVFYVLSAGWTLLSLALIFTGAMKMNAAQQAYFGSLTSADWFFSFSISVLSFAGAVSLFLLRRVAVALFAVAFGLNIALTLFHTVRTNWTEAVGGPGIVGIVLGWVVLIAVILYARSLAKKGVLA
ncbi:MAG: hypothetical protein HY695_11600 [Deltaproteobacteria bacterium]|nr:hypothetical protein [Deltaproteobacteria bacterium]